MKSEWVSLRIKSTTKKRLDRILDRMQLKNKSVGIERICDGYEENQKSKTEAK